MVAFKVGVHIRPQHTTVQALRAAWKSADALGVDSITIWDHFYPLTGDLAGPNFEGWTMLAAMAQATRRIRLGCQVAGMIYRHPAVLANMAATIDIISHGRLEVGLGAGWNQQECDAYGIELPPLRARFDQFDEGVQMIIGLLSQDTTTFEGKYFRLSEARCEPKPVQRPHPPIVIGGRGPNRTLRAVAKWAQQWNAITQNADEWRSLKEILLTRCDEVGRKPEEITCSVNIRIDPEQGIGPAVEEVSSYQEAGADLVIMNLPHRAEPGILEPLAEALAPLA